MKQQNREALLISLASQLTPCYYKNDFLCNFFFTAVYSLFVHCLHYFFMSTIFSVKNVSLLWEQCLKPGTILRKLNKESFSQLQEICLIDLNFSYTAIIFSQSQTFVQFRFLIKMLQLASQECAVKKCSLFFKRFLHQDIYLSIQLAQLARLASQLIVISTILGQVARQLATGQVPYLNFEGI